MNTTTRLESPSTLLLTLSEVATHLRCTRRSVERQVAQHRLHVVRFGRSVRVAAGDTTPSRYGSHGRWHARVTIGSGLDGRPIREHLSRATKSALERAVRDLERGSVDGVPVLDAQDHDSCFFSLIR